MKALLAAMLLAATPAPPARPLTPDGWGPVKIGMTKSQVERALHARLEGDEIGTEDPKTCVEMSPVGPDQGVWFMFVRHRLARVSLGKGSNVTTRRGIGVGASAAEVRRAYGPSLKAEPHAYSDSPAQYLTYWTTRGKRGVRFETNERQRVQVIHAGTNSIQYIEGCE